MGVLVMRYEEFLKRTLDEFTSESIIKPDAFPAMELYADQVAGFFDERLGVYGGVERGKGEPALTEASVANCVKRGALPRPVRKKYSRDHMVIMTMLFYMTSVLSVDEAESVMRPFIANYASAFDDKIDFHKLYAAIAPVLEKERTSFSAETQGVVADVKAAIRGEGLEDDDNTELLLLILSVAARADAANYAARTLFNEYFAKPGGTRGKSAAPSGEKKK
jgi:hypothetical protein